MDDLDQLEFLVTVSHSEELNAIMKMNKIYYLNDEYNSPPLEFYDL